MAGNLQEESATDRRMRGATPASIEPIPQADDWTQIKDPRVKKRVQNRVAQRLYRQRQKARMEELEAKFRIHEEQSNTSNPSSSVTKSTESTTLLAKSGINDTNQYGSPGRTQRRGPRRQKRSRQRSIQTIGGPSGRKGTSNDLQECLSEPTSGLMVSRRGASISDNQNCTPDDHRPGVYTPIDASTQSLGGRERSSPPVPTSDPPHGHAEKVIPNQVHYENALGISNPVDFADLQLDAVGSPCLDSSLDVFGAFWSNDFDCAGVIGTPTTMKVSWEAGSIPRMRTENRPIHRNDSFEYQQQTTYPASTETSNSTGQIPFPPPGRDASMQERISYVMDCARHVGFEDFDSVAETYYDSHFSDTSGLNGVQKISRNRHLPRILAALRRTAQNWTAWERRGFNQEMVIGAEKILLEEYDSSNTLKQFSNWTTGASLDLNNHISIMTRCLQDELPNLWALIMTLCSENTALGPQDRTRIGSLAISMMCGDPYSSNSLARLESIK